VKILPSTREINEFIYKVNEFAEVGGVEDQRAVGGGRPSRTGRRRPTSSRRSSTASS
jgi:hypothetical protein